MVKQTKAIVPKKDESKKTFVDFIEDSRSGLPSKSELESREKRAFLKKTGASLSKAGSQAHKSEMGSIAGSKR